MKPFPSFSFLFLLSELQTVTAESDSRDQSANMPPAAASTFLTHDTTTGTSHPQLSYNTLTKLSFSSTNTSEAPTRPAAAAPRPEQRSSRRVSEINTIITDVIHKGCWSRTKKYKVSPVLSAA